MEQVEFEFERQTPDLSDVSCPECDGELTEESIVKHELSKQGYVHDDVELECKECDHTFALGMPIGVFSEGEDLRCDACNDYWMMVHRVQPFTGNKEETVTEGKVVLHLKCPNCFYFKKIERMQGEQGVALTGYPVITGAVKESEVEAFGYPSNRYK